jgi:hypothetical protein
MLDGMPSKASARQLMQKRMRRLLMIDARVLKHRVRQMFPRLCHSARELEKLERFHNLFCHFLGIA